ARAARVARTRTAIERDVAPPNPQLAEFLEGEYIPACRESVGLWDTPDGPAHYAQRVRSFTTTDLDPDAVHALGLSEVARVRSAMDDVRRKVDYDGSLGEFCAYLRSDPRWRNTDASSMLDRYRAILREMDAKLPLLFGHVLRAEVVLREIPAHRAKTASSGSYSSAPADGSRPAYFN